MRGLLNQHSFVVAGALLLGALWFLLRGRASWLRWSGLAAAAVLLALVFTALRTGAGDVRTPADLDAALASGEPVVLQFFSNY